MEECCINFPGPVSRKTMSHLVIDYLKYILYYRGQFPLPLDQLSTIKKRENRAAEKSSVISPIYSHGIFSDEIDHTISLPAISTRTITSSRAEQKFFESISKFDDFFNELTRILETKNVMEIVLNLGPNLMNPKELYHIALPPTCFTEHCCSDYASLQSCKMQFFKHIVNSNIWADLKSDSLLPISVMLLLKNGDSLDQYMEQKRFYSLPKNCKHRTVRFIDNCDHKSSTSVELDKINCVSVADNFSSSTVKTSGLWVKLKPDLRGFKSFKESK